MGNKMCICTEERAIDKSESSPKASDTQAEKENGMFAPQKQSLMGINEEAVNELHV